MLSDMQSERVLVADYDELRRYLNAFAREYYGLMTIVGDAATSKTESAKAAMNSVHGPNGWSLIRGKHTPLALYAKLYESRSRPIVFDDLDALLADSNNTTLLKCVCETKPVKRVEWGSQHAVFRGAHAQLPRSFDSISKVCIIANDFGRTNPNVAALFTRGFNIVFRPTVVAVHMEVARGGWFGDEEVFEFIGQHLWLMTRPNMRLYVLAAEHKRAGLEWRELTLRMMKSAADEKTLVVAQLLADSHFDAERTPEEARSRAFTDQCGASRATYFRIKRDLLTRRGLVDSEAIKAVKLAPVRDLRRYADREHEEFYRQLRRETYGAIQEEDRSTAKATEVGDDQGGSSPNEVEKLRAALQRAINREKNEQAAEIRDELRRLAGE